VVTDIASDGNSSVDLIVGVIKCVRAVRIALVSLLHSSDDAVLASFANHGDG
jgi:hypothetical protein